jgi:hypothetical protein
MTGMGRQLHAAASAATRAVAKVHPGRATARAVLQEPAAVRVATRAVLPGRAAARVVTKAELLEPAARRVGPAVLPGRAAARVATKADLLELAARRVDPAVLPGRAAARVATKADLLALAARRVDPAVLPGRAAARAAKAGRKPVVERKKVPGAAAGTCPGAGARAARAVWHAVLEPDVAVQRLARRVTAKGALRRPLARDPGAKARQADDMPVRAVAAVLAGRWPTVGGTTRASAVVVAAVLAERWLTVAGTTRASAVVVAAVLAERWLTVAGTTRASVAAARVAVDLLLLAVGRAMAADTVVTRDSVEALHLVARSGMDAAVPVAGVAGAGASTRPTAAVAASDPVVDFPVRDVRPVAAAPVAAKVVHSGNDSPVHAAAAVPRTVAVVVRRPGADAEASAAEGRVGLRPGPVTATGNGGA